MMSPPTFFGTYTDLDKVVFGLTDLLRFKTEQWDAFVTSGISGIVVASPLANNMGRPLVIVREGPPPRGKAVVHSNVVCLGTRCCFVDDIIDTGATLQRCRDALGPLGMAVVAVALYTDLEYRVL